ncbi:WD40/YVTN/BNR-like repeat-containing protein [Roseivirga sp. BDSF3-8]|uniref:WD40/YVTN/BNR-like repeat-containing protein n=1 Tax=Roseivirga sp. BDSF3-8 TaxID=3241598 RepID=UPI003531D6D7
MKKLAPLLVLIIGTALSASAQKITLQPDTLPLPLSYRGLHVLSDSLVWVSGPEGTLLRTTDGGNTWKQLPPPPADSLDYRTLWAFDEQTSVIGSAGQPAMIYRTEDAGREWRMTYRDTSGQAFFDALLFGSDSLGLVMSDPVDGKFLLLATVYGGREWRPIPPSAIPDAGKGEAGFAASNSGMIALGDSVLMFATGGSQVRVIRLDGHYQGWHAVDVPMDATSEARGIYSMAANAQGNIVAVGGDYTQTDDEENNLVVSADGGLTWERIDNAGLRGYRSGVAWIPGTEATFIAVGTSGMDITYDGGRTWQPLSNTDLNAIRFSPSGKVGWAVGREGKVVRITVW